MVRRYRAFASLLALAACNGDDTDVGFAVVDGLASSMLCVRGTSASDVWAVGADVGEGPLVMRWDGASWETIATGATGSLWWVHPTADRVTLVGEGLLLELDRATGVIQPHDVVPAGITLFGVWGTASDDVWAVGGDVAGGSAPAVLRRDATGWAVVSDPALDAIAAPDMLYKVHGDGANTFVVGTNGLVLATTGGGFAVESAASTSPLFTVDAGGPVPVAVGGFGQAVVLHREGSAWVDHSPAFTPALSGVAGAGGALVAVGQSGTVARWDGSAWVVDPVAPTDLDLHSVWIDPDGGVWAAGGSLFSVPMVDGVIVTPGGPG